MEVALGQLPPRATKTPNSGPHGTGAASAQQREGGRPHMQNPEGRGLTPHKTWSLDDHRPQCAKLNSLMGGGGELSVSQAGRRLLSKTPEGRGGKGQVDGFSCIQSRASVYQRTEKETHPGAEIPPTRVCVCVHVRAAGSSSLRPRGLQPARLLCPRDSQARIQEWLATPSSRGAS